MTVLEACRGDWTLELPQGTDLDLQWGQRSRVCMLASFELPHFTVVLADLRELTLARLYRCFDEATPNPGRAPEG
jgi:hypothetical protein